MEKQAFSNEESLETQSDVIINPYEHLRCRVIDTASLAESMRARVRAYVQTHQPSNPIQLVGILADNNPPFTETSEFYSERIHETLHHDGIRYQLIRCPTAHRDSVEAVIRRVNNDPEVHGILVFYPIFKQGLSHTRTTRRRSSRSQANQQEQDHPQRPRNTYLSRSGVYYTNDDDYLRDIVTPSKDVEGLHYQCQSATLPRNLFRARGGMPREQGDYSIPCTALAVLRILDTYHAPLQLVGGAGEISIPEKNALLLSQQQPSTTDSYFQHAPQWAGCTITIINRSEILGRPLASLLALQGATVYSVDERSIIQFHGGNASHGPRMQNLTKSISMKDCVEKSTIVVTGVPATSAFSLPTEWIQPGTTLVNVSESPCVQEEALSESITYVPKVGKVTVAALEENLVRLHERHQKKQKQECSDT